MTSKRDMHPNDNRNDEVDEEAVSWGSAKSKKEHMQYGLPRMNTHYMENKLIWWGRKYLGTLDCQAMISSGDFCGY